MHWENTGENNFRFPERRKGKLDTDVLKRVVMTQQVLFFYQLVSPLCSTKKHGVLSGERIPYYLNLDKWSNLYPCQLGLGILYGYMLNNTNLPDIVHHNSRF